MGSPQPSPRQGGPVSPAGPSPRQVPVPPVQVLSLEGGATSIISCLKKFGADVQVKTRFQEKPTLFDHGEARGESFPLSARGFVHEMAHQRWFLC